MHENNARSLAGCIAIKCNPLIFFFINVCSNNSICREELEALTEITHQIKNKLNQSNGDVNSNVSHQQSNESVDLDNLFAFLSEVTPNSTANNSNSNSTSNNSNHSSSTVSINNNTSIIDEIGETFRDLDVELENVLQQEMDVLGNENATNSNKCPPNAKMGKLDVDFSAFDFRFRICIMHKCISKQTFSK